MGDAGCENFILSHTMPVRPAFVPEITLQLATEITPIWEATETWLAERNLPPPYWAFAWPGGLALARHMLDHPTLVAGRRVLDFAAGCGIAAIACARAGAHVVAAEIDPMAIAAIALNAAQNGVTIETRTGDLPAGAACDWDVILCGDVCYEAPMTHHILPWLRRMAAQSEVWIADPGRAYLPKQGLTPRAEYQIPTTLELENRTICAVSLSSLTADPEGTLLPLSP